MGERLGKVRETLDQDVRVQVLGWAMAIAVSDGDNLAAPSSSYADGDVVDTVTTAIKENPGKSAGVAGCAAIIIFPPAAIWCAATLIGGATVDGDVQKLVKETVK